MDYILEELKQGNIKVLNTMDASDISHIFQLINVSESKQEILHAILSRCEKEGYWHGIAYNIFYLIYLEPEFQEHTFYLLHKEYIKPEYLLTPEIQGMLTHTSWGFDYIYHNLERVLDSGNVSTIIDILLEYSIDKPEIYQLLLEKVFTISNQEIREKFIRVSIFKHVSFDPKNIIKALYQNPDEFDYRQQCLPFCEEKPNLVLSELSHSLLFSARRNIEIKKVMLDYFEIFFQAEASKKMRVLDFFYGELEDKSIELLIPYLKLFDLYQRQKASDIDQMLTILINSHEDKYITDFLKNKEIKYLTSGSTTRVFQVGDKTLKFSLRKYEFDTERDLFLIAPTESMTIYDDDNQPILVIEIQDYLDKTYQGSYMKKEDIRNFMLELDKQGYQVTDPHCLDGNFNNFGFLRDYHDANIIGFDSPEDLPEWFKKRPIVLYDVDLVYKKGDKKMKTFGTMY